MEYILFYALSLICLFVGIRLAFKPVWVHPAQRLRIKGIKNYDFSVYLAFSVFGLLTLYSTVFLLALDPSELSEISGSTDFRGKLIFVAIGGFYIFFQALMFSLFLGMIEKFFVFNFGMKYSIRPFRCQKCMGKLKKIRLSGDLLTDQERVASQIRSIFFEAWHCPQCFSALSYDSMHLRAYLNESKKFRLCSECDEITMVKKFSRILKRSTTKQEGKMLIVYVCQYCDEEEEKMEVIPRENLDGGGGP